MSDLIQKSRSKWALFEYMLLLFSSCLCNEDFCYSDAECDQISNSVSSHRYLLYDVNPPEGFNLRRDVYMRFAILAYKLKNSKNEKLTSFKLVLPPWSHLYHWKYNPEPEHIPWGLFFDLDSLKSFAPVIEMAEFFQNINKQYSVTIDEVYILQHFEDMFETGNFEDRMKVEKCSKNYQLNYFFYNNITSNNVKCLSYHGPATKLAHLLNRTSAKTILFHHAEVALHEMFGTELYWRCRRSMRFNKKLRRIAADFRRKFHNSSDASDKTILPHKWQDEKPHRNAIGGPYLAVHLRRKDFIKGRSHQIPSLESAASQITELLKNLNLTLIYLATDATEEEYQQIKKTVQSPYKIMKYIPSNDLETKFKEGGLAIIEQIICSHARFFIGTYESTFSFRIQEEREILGFPTEATFNSFCRENSECPQPSVWKIVY